MWILDQCIRRMSCVPDSNCAATDAYAMTEYVMTEYTGAGSAELRLASNSAYQQLLIVMISVCMVANVPF